MKRFTNGKIFYHGHFTDGSFDIQNGRFQKLYLNGLARGPFDSPDHPVRGGHAKDNTLEIIDLEGALVIPGLIDMHSHGNSGFDFSACDYNGLVKIAEYLGKHGITSFAPASMTMPYETLAAAFANARKLHDFQHHSRGSIPAASGLLSRLAGIHMEGPFFSSGKRGAQDPAWLRKPVFDEFQTLMHIAGGLIKVVDIAPELDGAMEFIRNVSHNYSACTISVAHTEADYDTVCSAFQNGASHMTHLFNGMNGIHHRSPGPVCAAHDTPGIFVELICDGIHIHPAVIRMVFDLFPGRVILISDALACCGMPDGLYALGGQQVFLRDGRATLADGTLAGSASNLFHMLQHVVSFGIPLEEAITSATLNPAKQLHVDGDLGSIEEGKKADFLVCSESLQLQSVYINGLSNQL